MCLFLITLGEPVSYPVNQVDGFELTIEKPTWSPFKGYTFNNLEFSLGGDSTGLQGSIVQKYDYYGTRLEAGTYRVVLEMKAKDGTPHYLAAEFDVE